MEDTRHKFVIGLLFSPDRQRVLLIEKNRPAWQKGRLNGVGGGVEPGELFRDAIHREIVEEAGLVLPKEEMSMCVRLNHAGNDVRFYRVFANIDLARAQTDERLHICPVNELPANILHNLRWIIPLMLDNVAFPVQIEDLQKFQPGDWERGDEHG